MADPLSLAVNIYTTFKEVYLVSKFIHRTVLSAKNHTQERRSLRLEFEHELLFLQSLGRIYLGANGIVHSPDLDQVGLLLLLLWLPKLTPDIIHGLQRWLQYVFDILERMRLVCGDYARIAAEDDAEYRQYSPFLNERTSDTRVIEFNIDEPLPSLPEPTFFTKTALRWLGIRKGSTFDNSHISWKWALVEKRKFKNVLERFQKLNGKLKDILPLYCAAQTKVSALSPTPEAFAVPGTSEIPHDDNARRLGISRHVRLRELSYNPAADSSNYKLEGFSLEADDNAGTLITGTLHKRHATSSPETVLVEYKSYLPPLSDIAPESTEIELHRSPVQQLAKLLKSAGSHDMHTLPLRGVIEQNEQHRYAFIFDFPRNVDGTDQAPISLRFLLGQEDINHRLSLSQRFAVARQISCSIGAFHADGWVHKSIRSASVVFFHHNDHHGPGHGSGSSPSGRKSGDDMLIKSPFFFLVNFEYSRPETAMTSYDFDDDLERNLYRHPDRQGRPKVTFSKLHDIYALGVVLLEIGLWEPVSSMYRRAKGRMGNGAIPSPAGIRKRFVQLAEQRLAHHMGDGYVEAVLACLSGRFDNLTSRADFPMMFHEEVIQKLDLRYISE
ncbi:hypothetical protein SLS54_008542 [Diplodia seriata]